MTEDRTVQFPKLTDEEHGLIIEALAYYRGRRFVHRPHEIESLQDYIRENVEHDEKHK